jgi:adenylate kinase
MMLSHLDSAHPDDWILDGYPRTVQQAQELDDHLNKEKCPINFVINLDVNWDVILDRIEKRWIHASSGRTYNLSFNPPKIAGKDDITGEPLTKRPDDCPISFRKRLAIYQAQTLPVLEYYGDRGVLHNFKGDTSDAITPKLLDQLNAFFE